MAAGTAVLDGGSSERQVGDYQLVSDLDAPDPVQESRRRHRAAMAAAPRMAHKRMLDGSGVSAKVTPVSRIW
jgi:hypothetical protein